MITRKKYNEALDIIEAYHKEIFSIPNINLRDFNKTEVLNWKWYHTCSTRLHNILKQMEGLFVEDIDKEMFLQFRNAGSRSWFEFVNLRGY